MTSTFQISWRRASRLTATPRSALRQAINGARPDDDELEGV